VSGSATAANTIGIDDLRRWDAVRRDIWDKRTLPRCGMRGVRRCCTLRCRHPRAGWRGSAPMFRQTKTSSGTPQRASSRPRKMLGCIDSFLTSSYVTVGRGGGTSPPEDDIIVDRGVDAVMSVGGCRTKQLVLQYAKEARPARRCGWGCRRRTEAADWGRHPALARSSQGRRSARLAGS